VRIAKRGGGPGTRRLWTKDVRGKVREPFPKEVHHCFVGIREAEQKYVVPFCACEKGRVTTEILDFRGKLNPLSSGDRFCRDLWKEKYIKR